MQYERCSVPRHGRIPHARPILEEVCPSGMHTAYRVALLDPKFPGKWIGRSDPIT